MVDSVEHEAPTGEVVIEFSDVVGVFTATLVNGDSHEEYSMVGGRITIPLADFTNAITNHATLSLQRDMNDYGGLIVFLPRTESEPYVDGIAIKAGNGEAYSISGAAATTYIDVSFATELVVTGSFTTDTLSVLYAYDSDRRAVRSLVTRAGESVHIIPDGSYTYVRASSRSSYDHSLLVYYRDRRRQ